MSSVTSPIMSVFFLRMASGRAKNQTPSHSNPRWLFTHLCSPSSPHVPPKKPFEPGVLHDYTHRLEPECIPPPRQGPTESELPGTFTFSKISQLPFKPFRTRCDFRRYSMAAGTPASRLR